MSGIKIHDLSLFRDCSKARSVSIIQTGGDVFIASPNPSDTAVLWGENFGARERKFLREMLTTEIVTFSLQDTYQMHVQTLWHASAIAKGISAMQGMRRQGKMALLLHDLTGDLTTSWAWAKFMRPLYRQNFSVIAVDLPGFGKSAVSQVSSCPLSRWQPWSSHIMTKIMEEMGLMKCHILATGHAAGILIMIMLNSPHRLDGRHVLVNPIFDRNKLFADCGSDSDPPPGAKAGWREEIRERQKAAFISMVRTNGIKLWFIFNSDGKHGEIKSGKTAPNKQVREEWEQAYDSHEFLMEACQDEFAAVNIKMTEVTNADMCQAQCGKTIPVRMIIPSRHLKTSVARYLADKWELPWAESFMPKHIMQRMKDPKLMDEAFGLGDDSDDETEIPLSRPLSRAGPGLPVERTLELLPKNFTEDHHLENNATKHPLALVASVNRVSQKVNVPRKMIAWDEASGDTNASKSSRRTLQRSTSETTAKREIRRTKDSSLSAAAEVASSRLRQSGALAKPVPLPPNPVKTKKRENWAQHSQFEPDLSFGVRKMFHDSFEASVDTYRQEQEKAMAAHTKFRSRSALYAPNHHREAMRYRATDNTG